ncbi:MAG: hypothetical protein AAF211_22835 [Myxococcota bacterium]
MIRVRVAAWWFLLRELAARRLGRRRTVRVVGHSMAPTLRDGDELWIRRRRWDAVPLGALVVVQVATGRPAPGPELLVKRLSSRGEASFAVTSDDPLGSTDSRRLGSFPPDALVGEVTARLDHRGRPTRVGRGPTRAGP